MSTQPPTPPDTHTDIDQSIAEVDVLMAASLCLMTRWAEDCGCHRGVIARKIESNLRALIHHPAVGDALSQVMANCHVHWQSMAASSTPAASHKAHDDTVFVLH